ncbi:MAG TPA: hypothetical protein VHC47_13880 [Mucilaginibacter sp.]|nr:hypothetical protein [Mucilaginibacter sp.]
MDKSLTISKLCLICLLLAGPLTAFCQLSDNEAIKNVINRMCDAMRDGDTITFKEFFADRVNIQYISPKNDTTRNLVTVNAADFLHRMAMLKTESWDEKMIRFDDVNVSNGIAVVWGPYKFYIGKKLDHCGIATYQMMKTPWGWKIVSMFYSVKSGNCPD